MCSEYYFKKYISNVAIIFKVINRKVHHTRKSWAREEQRLIFWIRQKAGKKSCMKS